MDIRAIESYPVRATPTAPGADASVVETRPVPAVSPVDPEGIPAQQNAAGQDEESRNKDIAKVAQGVNTVLAESGNHVRFVLHDKTDKMMVQIVDNTSDKVLRTIPSKELLDLAARIDELIGMLVDKKT